VVDAIFCGKAQQITGKTLNGCVSMGVSAVLSYQHGSGKGSAHSQYAGMVQLIWSDRGGTVCHMIKNWKFVTYLCSSLQTVSSAKTLQMPAA